MARYTGLFKITAPSTNLQQPLGKVLEACNFDVVYQAGDYMMAREVPGGVAFQKLVTVEVLVDRTNGVEHQVHMQMVLKNEELPLQTNNHCQQMFQRLSQAIAEANHWKVIETVANA